MSQNQTAEAAVLSLDAEKIGDVLVRLGLVAYQLGHAKVTGTLIPYANHPDLLSPEANFVRDLISRPVGETIDRWYGGESAAREMLLVTAERMMEDRP
jgi:hypothetical protein